METQEMALNEYGTPIYNIKLDRFEDTDTIVMSYYEEPIVMGFRGERLEKEDKKRSVEDEKYANYVFHTNLIKTKKIIYDYAKSNDWDYFCTFTFAPEDKQINRGVRYDRTVDRYDYKKCKKVLSKWLNHIKNRFCPEIKYLFIAEYHKDKAIHFHGLISNINKEIMGFNRHKEVELEGNKFSSFHTDKWKYGRNDFSEIHDKKAITTYITKYVTKEIICEKGQDRYICSKGLKISDVKKFYSEEDCIYWLNFFSECGYELRHCTNGKNKTKYFYLQYKGDSNYGKNEKVS